MIKIKSKKVTTPIKGQNIISKISEKSFELTNTSDDFSNCFKKY